MAQFARSTKTVFVPLDSEKREPSIHNLRSYSNLDSFSNSVVYISKDAQPLSPVLLKSINPDVMLWDFNSKKFITDNEIIQNNLNKIHRNSCKSGKTIYYRGKNFTYVEWKL